MIDDTTILGEHVEVFPEAELIHAVIGSNSYIDKYTRVEYTTLGENVRLERNNQIVYSEIGRYSYTGTNTVIKDANIGKFNSIAWNVSIGGNTHDLNHVTTHSFLVYAKWQMGGSGNWQSALEACETGNDVWIGSGANILRGVHIGDGAVIGASSVITKDVPPYAIVVGNPGRILRMRCKEAWIERLEALKWWDFPAQVIRNHFELFKGELTEEVISQLEEIKAQL